MKLRREPIRQPPPSPAPVQVGPLVIDEAKESAILSRSLSSQSLRETEAPRPRPATPEGQLRMAVDMTSGGLTLVRVGTDDKAAPHPRPFSETMTGVLDAVLPWRNRRQRPDA
jgi:hypothetical protein